MRLTGVMLHAGLQCCRSSGNTSFRYRPMNTLAANRLKRTHTLATSHRSAKRRRSKISNMQSSFSTSNLLVAPAGLAPHDAGFFVAVSLVPGFSLVSPVDAGWSMIIKSKKFHDRSENAKMLLEAAVKWELSDIVLTPCIWHVLCVYEFITSTYESIAKGKMRRHACLEYLTDEYGTFGTVGKSTIARNIEWK